MAMISAEELLGGQYMRLEPRGSITYTQDTADIIGLISQMIYNPKENN